MAAGRPGRPPPAGARRSSPCRGACPGPRPRAARPARLAPAAPCAQVAGELAPERCRATAHRASGRSSRGRPASPHCGGSGAAARPRSARASDRSSSRALTSARKPGLRSSFESAWGAESAPRPPRRRSRRPVAPAAAVALDLARDRRVRAAKQAGDGPGRLAAEPARARSPRALQRVRQRAPRRRRRPRGRMPPQAARKRVDARVLEPEAAGQHDSRSSPPRRASPDPVLVSLREALAPNLHPHPLARRAQYRLTLAGGAAMTRDRLPIRDAT